MISQKLLCLNLCAEWLVAMVDVPHQPLPINHSFSFPGDHGEEVTPVPIPNTEVKGLSGDGTATAGRGRVARRRVLSGEPRHSLSGLLFFADWRAALGVYLEHANGNAQANER